MHACMLSSFSNVWLFATPWTAACQAPLSMEFSMQEQWKMGFHFFFQDLPNSGIELASPVSLALQADSQPLSHQESHIYINFYINIYIYIYVYSVMFSPLSSILLKTFPSDISGTLIFHKVHRSIISIVTYRSLWTSGQNWWLNHEINTLAVSKLHLEFYLPLKTKTSSPSQPLYAPGLDS